MLARAAAALTLLAAATAHDDGMPINPALGVPGFPDCTRLNPTIDMTVGEAAMDLSCAQKAGRAGTIKVGCIGDSITAGVHSSGGNHTYPGQLQIMLDQSYPGKYSVTNLGACGSTMMKGADSPYWKRPQYKALTAAKWDIIIIMLGTNDAKDTGSHGPANWQHDCTGPDALKCSFAVDYASMIALVKTLGTTAAGPKIYTAIPPPLMQNTAYGMNQTVINDVFPKLVPAINAANKMENPSIDVFTALGGVPDWRSTFQAKGCQRTPGAPPFSPMAGGCFADNATGPIMYVGGNTMPGPDHGVQLVDTAAHCCAKCQSFKNCSFWTYIPYNMGGTAAKPSCYGKAGSCCWLKNADGFKGRTPAGAGTVSGSTKQIPVQPPPPPPVGKCPLFCDAQSCDQCHPDNNGYTAMAAAMKKGIGL